jgi:hypothetical protein
VLKLRGQPVAKIIFVCMLLRNAYVTMNADQTAEYFMMLPPSFELWTSQGPHAHAIPVNNIFSEDFVDSDEESNSDSDEN